MNITILIDVSVVSDHELIESNANNKTLIKDIIVYRD